MYMPFEYTNTQATKDSDLKLTNSSVYGHVKKQGLS